MGEDESSECEKPRHTGILLPVAAPTLAQPWEASL